MLLAPEPELMQIVAVPGTLPETARERAVHELRITTPCIRGLGESDIGYHGASRTACSLDLGVTDVGVMVTTRTAAHRTIARTG